MLSSQIVRVPSRFIGWFADLTALERAVHDGGDGACELPPKRWRFLAKDAASVTTLKSTLGSGDALKTKLNTALKNEGLKESTGVTAPATGSTAARSTASPAQMLVAALSLAVFARM